MSLNYYTPAAFLGESRIHTDICIYGATSGGIIAALKCKRLGYSVELLAFGGRLGGMSTSGLGCTDIGNKRAIGGMALSFYQELGARYGTSEAWRFEPHVAEEVFQAWLKEDGIEPRFHQHITEVIKDGNTIEEIKVESGESYRAKVFIDATYEGDLLALAGVSFHVGRESNSTYDEVYNGVHFGSPYHNFTRFVDPYKLAGNPKSGLLAGISSNPPGAQGEGDARVQAYNFRLCLTKDDHNKRPFLKPLGYDPEDYTLLARYINAGAWDAISKCNEIPNGKTDTNNNGGFSTDFIGGSYDWPQGSYLEREKIFQEHVRYTQGLLWFLQNDPRLPASVRDEAGLWGLTADEFQKTGGWSPELYVREGRRMISDYVMTEHDCIGRKVCSDPVALAAYTMDSHNCQRVVVGNRVINEGNVEIGGFSPYPISYRSIIPREEECNNLLVPFCLSASHIAFGSIRMEPVFMVLAQSAATAAHLAIKNQSSVQKVDYSDLRQEILNDGQILSWEHHNG